MLVLSRQRDETIMIGDDIEITIVDIRGDKVRLGITAPATIPVHRKEVYEAIQRENREAAKVRMEDLPNLPKGSVRPGGGSSVPPGGQRSQMPTTRPGNGENKAVPEHPTQGTPGSPSGVPKNPATPESPNGPGNGTA